MTGPNDAVDWAPATLVRCRSVALVQAGTFRSDAGALFGPVPKLLWERWVRRRRSTETPPAPGA